MYVKTIKRQHRRDFTAIYKCGECSHEVEKSGYDDRNFHDNVIPNMECPKCKKSRKDLKIKKLKKETKYPESYHV